MQDQPIAGQASQAQQQYQVPATPFHRHTGVDSPQISYNDLLNKPTISVTIPAGLISAYGGTSAPTGYLLCDGSSYLRSSYANLFAVIGTTFGSVDINHFSVPDLRASVPAGYKSGDPNFGTLGTTVGEATHTLTLTEIPAHSHDVKYNPVNAGGNNAITNGSLQLGIDTSTSVGGVTIDRGGSGAHNNIQVSITLNFIIST